MSRTLAAVALTLTRSRFAPKDADVAKVIAALSKYGLTAERTTATTLKVTDLPAEMERALSVSFSRPSFRPHIRTVSPKLEMASAVPQTTTPDAPG